MFCDACLLLSQLCSVRELTAETYDEPASFCHRCGLFNDEDKNIKRNNIMDATISTSECIHVPLDSITLGIL